MKEGRKEGEKEILDVSLHWIHVCGGRMNE